MKHRLNLSSMLGGGICILTGLAFRPSFIEWLLLFAFFVIVPLVLSLTETRKRSGEIFSVYRLAVGVQFPAAVTAAVSLLLPQGIAAGILSLGWLFFTLLVGLYGCVRFAERGWRFLEEGSVDVGLVYIVLGGAWFCLDRFGVEPLHFSPVIVRLTAIHFHYSAFVAPIFAGMLGRWWKTSRGEIPGAYRLAVLGIMVGPMLVAAGITFSRFLEWAFVTVFVISLLLYAGFSFATAKSFADERRAGWLLVVSSASLLLTMALAFLYAFGRWTGESVVTIPQMVFFHGFGNALFFALLGSLAWKMRHPKERYPAYGIPMSRLRGHSSIRSDFFARNGCVDARKPPQGLVDDFSVYARETFSPDRLPREIVRFYEHTRDYEMEAETEWRRWFRVWLPLYKAVVRRVQQINLPAGNCALRMFGDLLPLDDERDGRKNVRAWVRTAADGETIFAAAYSTHTFRGETYMNIALPLPYATMTGILRPAQDGRRLILTTVPRKNREGDEGIYLHRGGLTLRLPLHERFEVWPDSDRGQLRAVHRMWMFGWAFLTIRYRIWLRE